MKEGQTQEPVPGWISVKERLPKNRTDVIVWDFKKKTFREDYYTNKYGDTGWAHSRQESISHWIKKRHFNKLIEKMIRK